MTIVVIFGRGETNQHNWHADSECQSKAGILIIRKLKVGFEETSSDLVHMMLERQSNRSPLGSHLMNEVFLKDQRKFIKGKDQRKFIRN